MGKRLGRVLAGFLAGLIVAGSGVLLADRPALAAPAVLDQWLADVEAAVVDCDAHPDTTNKVICDKLRDPAWQAACEATSHESDDMTDPCISYLKRYKDQANVEDGSMEGEKVEAPQCASIDDEQKCQDAIDAFRQNCTGEVQSKDDDPLGVQQLVCESLADLLGYTLTMDVSAETQEWANYANGGGGGAITPYMFCYAVGLVLMLCSLISGFGGVTKNTNDPKIRTYEVLGSMGIRASTFVPICSIVPGLVGAVMMLLVDPATNWLHEVGFKGGAEALITPFTQAMGGDMSSVVVSAVLTNSLVIIIASIIGIGIALAVSIEIAMAKFTTYLMMCMLPPALGLGINPATRGASKNIMVGLFTAMLVRPCIYLALWASSLVLTNVELEDNASAIWVLICWIGFMAVGASAPALAGYLVAPLIGQMVGGMSQSLQSSVAGAPGRIASSAAQTVMSRAIWSAGSKNNSGGGVASTPKSKGLGPGPGGGGPDDDNHKPPPPGGGASVLPGMKGGMKAAAGGAGMKAGAAAAGPAAPAVLAAGEVASKAKEGVDKTIGQGKGSLGNQLNMGSGAATGSGSLSGPSGGSSGVASNPNPASPPPPPQGGPGVASNPKPASPPPPPQGRPGVASNPKPASPPPPKPQNGPRPRPEGT